MKEEEEKLRRRQIQKLQTQPGNNPMDILTNFWQAAQLDKNETFLRE
jgi:formiminotetrahydrofolate cyclodeaminase